MSPAKATAVIGTGFHLLETTRKGTAVERSDIAYLRDSVSAAALQIAPLRSLQNLLSRWHSMVNSLEQHQLRLSAFRWLDHLGALFLHENAYQTIQLEPMLMNTFEILQLYAAGERDFPETKLSNAHLVGENLSGINLSRSILWATDLSNTILKRANLTLTSLAWSDLRGANLSGADLSGADLSGADLSGANLSGANLSGTILIQANLSGAIMPNGITQN